MTQTHSVLSTAVNITKICSLSIYEITLVTLCDVVSSCAMVVMVVLLKAVYLDNQRSDRRYISDIRSIVLTL